MHEWPLLIFTICVQAAIGGMLTLAIFYKKLEELGVDKVFKIMKVPLIAIAILSIVGLGASFAHLGAPSNALNTIRNLGSSWQSREILITGLFIGATCVTLGLSLLKKKVNLGLLIVTALIGLINIYCMGAIYATTLVSGWSSTNTYTSFYGTALVLGPVLVASFIVPLLSEKENEVLARSLVRNAFIISIFGFAIQLVGVSLFSSTMPEVNMIAGTNALAALEGYSVTIGFRWVIEVIGIGVLGYLSISNSKKLPLSVAFVSLVALFFAEGMSRYIFYVLGA